MLDDLDMLGAEGLSSQFIVLQVRSIDAAKLGQALGGGTKSVALPAALAVVDFMPRQALDLAMPLVVKMAKDDYGVELSYQLTNSPPPDNDKPRTAQGKGVLVAAAAAGIVGGWAASHFGVTNALRSILGRLPWGSK